jgi:CBS domain-containing protein
MRRDVARVNRDKSLASLVRVMADRRLSCLLVCEAGKPIGIISERDMLGLLARSGFDGFAQGLSAGDAMTSALITVKEGSTLGMANFKLGQHHIRRLPVVDDAGQLVGIITQSDMVRGRMCSRRRGTSASERA